MNVRRSLVVLAFVLGCGKQVKPDVPVERPATVIELARARALPDVARARFTIKVRSKALDVAGTTGGGLVVARPGRGRLDVFGPLGSALLTATSDGTALSVLLPKQEKQLVSPHAEDVIREATGGAAGLDDVLAALMGDLPFDDAEVRSMTLQEDGSIAVVLDGPRETSVAAVLDPVTATPRRVEALDGDGVMMLSATFEEFAAADEAGHLLPGRVALEVPALELTVDLRYKSWDVLAEAPDVFAPTVPDSFAVTPFEEALEELAGELTDSGARPSP